MKNVLVRFYGNWADEMDIQGYKIFTNEEWEVFQEKLKNQKFEIIVCIGTNEELEFSNGQDFLRRCSVETISDETAKVLEKYIDLDPFGIFDRVDPEW